LRTASPWHWTFRASSSSSWMKVLVLPRTTWSKKCQFFERVSIYRKSVDISKGCRLFEIVSIYRKSVNISKECRSEKSNDWSKRVPIDRKSIDWLKGLFLSKDCPLKKKLLTYRKSVNFETCWYVDHKQFG
jgi:hypothetical protein